MNQLMNKQNNEQAVQQFENWNYFEYEKDDDLEEEIQQVQQEVKIQEEETQIVEEKEYIESNYWKNDVERGSLEEILKEL